MITLSPITVKLRRAPFSGNIIEFCTFRDHVWKWILFGIFAKDRYDSVVRYFSVKNLSFLHDLTQTAHSPFYVNHGVASSYSVKVCLKEQV